MRALGGIDLATAAVHQPLVQPQSRSARQRDLHECASYFANGLAGRAQEEKWDDHRVIEQFYELEVV